MKISVRAKAGAKRPSVTQISDGYFAVAVREAAREGKANAAIVRALARHFGIAPSRIRLIRGAASRQKLFHIGE